MTDVVEDDVIDSILDAYDDENPLAEAESEANVSDSQAQSLDQLVDDFDALDL